VVGRVDLLLGSRGISNSVEGYHVATIANYNALTNAQPLLLHPSITNKPPLPTRIGSLSHTLISWGNVALINDVYKAIIRSEEEETLDDPESPRNDAVTMEYKRCKGLNEVIPIGIECASTPAGDGNNIPSRMQDETSYCGIVVERCQGLVRKVGVESHIDPAIWIKSDPRLELFFLI
jgi:hypothetical protein